MSAQSEAHSALPQAACSQLPRPTFQAPGSTVLRCVLTLDRLLGGKIHRTPSRFATIASSLLTAADLDASACLDSDPSPSRLPRAMYSVHFILLFSHPLPSTNICITRYSRALRRKSSPDEVRGSSGLEVASLHLRLTLIFDPFYRSANCADFGASVGFATLQPASAVHIETPLVQTSADDALDRPSAFAPHTLDIQSPKCLPLLGENGQNSPISIHLETPLAQTPADDALDGPSAFVRRVFDIQSTKCHPLLNEDVQNSPMPSSPPVRIVGGASGRLRPQIDLSQLPWAPHGATFPAPSSWTVVALITPAVLETGARTTSILAMSRTSSCPRPRSVPAALRDELVAALGNAYFACTACSTRSIAGHAKYVSAAWTFPTLRGHHHREVWMRFLCHVTDARHMRTGTSRVGQTMKNIYCIHDLLVRPTGKDVNNMLACSR
ncbi:hypothetical protein C8R46DRAFT_1221989 [Mycena filopes]|nr:hypothetical protein C8R46DRAFT_1221989 [Mycena filopes]